MDQVVAAKTAEYQRIRGGAQEDREDIARGPSCFCENFPQDRQRQTFLPARQQQRPECANAGGLGGCCHPEEDAAEYQRDEPEGGEHEPGDVGNRVPVRGRGVFGSGRGVWAQGRVDQDVGDVEGAQ